jgi:ketosteroid isomerase-like protein
MDWRSIWAKSSIEPSLRELIKLRASQINEDRGNLSSPYQALVDFYHAFNHHDMVAMADNWAQSDEVVMDNPLGGIKRGWSEIRPVYERIFNGGAAVKVAFFDYTIHESGNVFYAVGRERGSLRMGRNQLDLSIRTTRVFKKLDGRWRQLHHHGSIDDPAALATYQSAVRKPDERIALR